jgi:hypothetical protein
MKFALLLSSVLVFSACAPAPSDSTVVGPGPSKSGTPAPAGCIVTLEDRVLSATEECDLGGNVEPEGSPTFITAP